ncbi:MAG: WYL domain-containing protein [Pseudoclavibacter sp.]|nr:WYL domain-containing protein [Pseudoclavibacter sp.]
MRADRLVSMVLLLRQRGRMSAAELSRELEVSVRTVLRDVEALSSVGIPIYAERGRHGGFALLPGLRTELTGLNHDEAVALLVAGSRAGMQGLGLGGPLASAVLKILDALPEEHRNTASRAAERILVDPESDLLARPLRPEEAAPGIAAPVRRAVLAGRRLRIRYAAAGQEPAWRTVDPIGLVAARPHGYLLASRSGRERSYRLSRILAAEVLDEPARRQADVELERLWRERGERFRASLGRFPACVALAPEQREELVGTAAALCSERAQEDGRLRLELLFQDLHHAEWAVWRLAEPAEALEPRELREALTRRAARLVARHSDG